MAAPKKRNDALQPSAEELALRSASAGDSDFLFRIYRETMRDYSSAYIRWDDDRQRASLAHQLNEADVSIISVGNQDVGWLAVLETDDGTLLGHIYIASRFQNRGSGSAVLSKLIAGANAKGRDVLLTVLKNNPARRLYERFGFRVVGEDAMKYSMRRPHGI